MGAFIGYITQRIQEVLEVNSYGENDCALMGMGIIKQDDFQGISISTNGSGNKIQIGRNFSRSNTGAELNFNGNGVINFSIGNGKINVGGQDG